MKYLDLVDKLLEETAAVFTLKHFKPMLEKPMREASQEVQQTLDLTETLQNFSMLSWRRFEEEWDKPEEEGLTEEEFWIRFYQFSTMNKQVKVAKEVLELCKEKNRNEILEEKLQETMTNSQQLFDRIPSQFKETEEKLFDNIRALRPQLFHSDIVRRPKLFGFVDKVEADSFLKSQDSTLREVKLDDLIPHTFYYGDNILRCSAAIALTQNNRKLVESGLEIDF